MYYLEHNLNVKHSAGMKKRADMYYPVLELFLKSQFLLLGKASSIKHFYF